MNAKEYLLQEGLPVWISKMSDEELKSYEKDHPGAKKVTLDYIKRESFKRHAKYPEWVTGKKKVISHYEGPSGEKHKPSYVHTEHGKEMEYVEKDSKKVPVFPVHTEFKGKKELSHYADDSGSKFEPKDVKKETGDRTYAGYGNEREYVEPVHKTVDKLEKHVKQSLIKNIGTKHLASGVEVIDKDSLTKKPYTTGTVAVFDKDGEYMGNFSGANVEHASAIPTGNRGRRSYTQAKRSDLIANGSKFIFINTPNTYESAQSTEESQIRGQKNILRVSQKRDELAGKVKDPKSYYSDPKIEYYKNKLAKFKATKGDERIGKVSENKQKTIDEVKKDIDAMFAHDKEMYSTDYKKLMEKLNKIQTIHNVEVYHKKAKEGSLGTYDSEKYLSGLKTFGK